MTADGFKQRILPVQGRLFRLARLFLRNREEAEDALQDVLLRLWNNRHALDTYHSVEALAVQITKNLCLDRLKAHNRQKRGEADDLLTVQTPEVSPYRQAELTDSAALMRRLIEDLPEGQKLVLHLRDVEDYSFEEIEQVTGLTINNIRVTLSRARQRLREEYQKVNDYERDIEQLLERYYEGETTLTEEKRLRAFFQQDSIPAHLQSHTAQFRYFADARQDHPSIGFAGRLAETIHTPERRRWLTTPYWQVAASVLILLVGFAGGYFYGQQPGSSDPTAVAASGKQSSAGAIRQVLAFEGALQTSASERIQAVDQSTELDRIDADITQLLINTLNFDANVNVRLAACQALLHFEREPGVREALIQSLSIQTDPNVQLNLIDALVAIKERRAVRQMQWMAQNQQVLEAVRQKAEEGLQRLARPEQRSS